MAFGPVLAETLVATNNVSAAEAELRRAMDAVRSPQADPTARARVSDWGAAFCRQVGNEPAVREMEAFTQPR